MLKEVEAGEFAWDLSDEDVHTAVERRLKDLVGDVALKLHTGRSRNDQVASICTSSPGTRQNGSVRTYSPRCGRSSGWPRYEDLVLPGYTHLQRAQPILLSHHLLAHFEALRRDLRRFGAARRRRTFRRWGRRRSAARRIP